MKCRVGGKRSFADGGYQGPKLATLAAATGAWSIEIVKRRDAHRFVVLPKRWIVERTFWISRNRRLARNFERYSRSVAAWIRLAIDPHHAPPLGQPTHCS